MRSIRGVTEPGRDTIDRTNVREMVDPRVESWNQIASWLKLVAALSSCGRHFRADDLLTTRARGAADTSPRFQSLSQSRTPRAGERD